MFKIELDIGGWADYTEYITGTESIASVIAREEGEFSNKVLREKIDVGTLVFIDNLHTLVCKLINNDRCKAIPIRIYIYCNARYKIIFEGEIRSSDIKIRPYYPQCEVSAVYDNGYSSKIDAAKNHKVFLNSIKSRNSTPISVTPKSLLFMDVLGIYNQSRKVWDILDVIKFIVNYATDNKVSVSSSYLTANKYYITTVGQLLNLYPFINVGYEFPEVSIDNIFSELFKALAITTKYDIKTATLHIEKEEIFYSNVIVAELPIDISDTIDVETSKDYETITLGSDTYIEIATNDRIDDYPDSGILSFKREEINSCGSCNNRDSSLDLVNQWIIDTDFIKTCIVSPIGIEAEDFNKIVLIHGDSTQAINDSGFYNIAINNKNKALSHLKYLPYCFTKYYDADGNFKAVNSLELVPENPSAGLGSHLWNPWASGIYGQLYDFDKEIYDEPPQGYDNFTGIFNNNSGTILQKKFSFESVLKRRTGKKSNNKECKARVDIFWMDNTFTAIKGQYTNFITISKNDDGWKTLTAATPCIDLLPGDNVMCQLVFYYSGIGDFRIKLMQERTIFQSYSCGDMSTGMVIVYDGSAYNTYSINNKGVLDLSDYEKIKEDITNMVSINGTPYWISEMRYNYTNGNYNFKGIGNSINCCYNHDK